MAKKILEAEVLSNEEISPGIFRMSMYVPEAAAEAAAGQFVNIYPADKSLILPRPFGICDANSSEGTVDIVYQVVGQGTEEMSQAERGTLYRIAGPLGNGFDLSVFDDSVSGAGASGRSAVIIGGGVGCSPLLFLAKTLRKMGVNATAVLGFRKDKFLVEDFRDADCRVLVTTDEPDESSFLGTVVDCMRVTELEGDEYFACGPGPMLKAVGRYIKDRSDDSHLQVSMEERMGCGYGVCMGCSIDVKEPDENGNIIKTHRRVCCDGPVFRGSEVIWHD
ncbi:MAG: dihydroorotate dehydrogenase electron transfer subunit [Anaerovoracaceae bacterium]|nr:dihydroorotate dehydrogenase electron transfer subunit [Bacillota bacterium]MDY2670583.1 dihydroorotate dehydrogenase electron transfer subunit [Anaerovoracaceae bacterium]